MRASRDLGSDPSDHLGCTLWIWTMRAVLWPPEAAMELYTRLPSAPADPARTPGNGPRVPKSALLDSLQKPFREDEL